MKTSANGRKLIESFEGLILHAYDDANDHIVQSGETPKGVLTIGYGHTSFAGYPKVTVGQVITKEQADQILASDLIKVEQQVSALVTVPLNQNQFDALVSFHFNTGALGKSSLLKKLNASDYKGAAEGLMAWTKASQIGPGPVPGLVRRRQAEKDLFLKPQASGAGAAAVVIGTGAVAAATQAPHHLIPWLLAGAGVAALVSWLTYKHYHPSIPVEPVLPEPVQPEKV